MSVERIHPTENILLVIGYGSIGKVHTKNAESLGWSVFTVDSDPRAGTIARKIKEVAGLGARHAIIATPIKTHLEVICELLEIIPTIETILVEKPLLHPDQLRDGIDGLLRVLTIDRVFVGFSWRFHLILRAIKKMVDNGTFGPLKYASLSAREWVPKIAKDAWVQSGSHILDTARFLIGDLDMNNVHMWIWPGCNEFVSAHMSTLNGSTGVDIHVNCCNRGDYDYRIVIQGVNGSHCWQLQPDLDILYREMEAFLGDQQGLATLQDGIENVRLLAGGL